jgi:hypothetical protein
MALFPLGHFPTIPQPPFPGVGNQRGGTWFVEWNLSQELSRKPSVVGIQKGHEFPTGDGDTGVACRPRKPRMLRCVNPDSGIIGGDSLENLGRSIGASVVHHHDLEAPPRRQLLVLNAGYGITHELLSVPNGYNHRDEFVRVPNRWIPHNPQ